MPTLAKKAAITKLIEAADGMSADDLLDFHNELFPRQSQGEVDAKDNGAEMRKKVIDYLTRGLEVEEILDLWNVAFPETWSVSYDEETHTLHYLQAPESVRQAE
jgi:hypothetical protein